MSATEKSRIAWQPFTFRGVAAFSEASFDRFHLYQIGVALFCGFSIAAFVWINWSPVILGAMQKMPETARLDRGALSGVPTPVAHENHFISILVNPTGGETGQAGDVQVTFGRTGFDFCTFRSQVGDYNFGCFSLDYDKDWSEPLGRSTLEPWWGAWRGMILSALGFVVFLTLLATWLVMALIYSLPVSLLAFVCRRRLSWIGSCRLAGAALMPGALLMSLGIWAYGFFLIDIVRLALIVVLHVIVPWIYLAAAPLMLEKITPYPGENKGAAQVAVKMKEQAKKNPFEEK